VKGGGTLLSVHCDTSEQISLAKEALRETGAKDIAASGEESSGSHDHAKDVRETSVAGNTVAGNTVVVEPITPGVNPPDDPLVRRRVS
jgi:hypothetical protein